MFWEDTLLSFSLMSSLNPPLSPARQLYSFSPASEGAELEGQVFELIGCCCVNTDMPWYTSEGLMQR